MAASDEGSLSFNTSGEKHRVWVIEWRLITHLWRRVFSHASERRSTSCFHQRGFWGETADRFTSSVAVNLIVRSPWHFGARTTHMQSLRASIAPYHCCDLFAQMLLHVCAPDTQEWPRLSLLNISLFISLRRPRRTFLQLPDVYVLGRRCK